MGVGPAYVALVVEAQVDAGVAPRHARRPGAPSSSIGRRWPARPRCCAAREYDTLARAPRGHLARRRHRPRASARSSAAGVRAAFSDAMDAVVTGAADGTRALLVLATARDTIADYVNALFLVYTILIFVYILELADLRVRGPAAVLALVDAVLGFLRDVCEPYLRHLPALHPAARPARPQPDRRDHRAAASCGGIVVRLIRG